MTRDEAGRRLTKLGLEGQIGKGVTSPERRAEAKERYTHANADHQDLLRRIEGQFGAERKAIARRHDQAFADMTAYKFTVWRRDRIGLIEVAKAIPGERRSRNSRSALKG